MSISQEEVCFVVNNGMQWWIMLSGEEVLGYFSPHSSSSLIHEMVGREGGPTWIECLMVWLCGISLN